MAQYFVGEIRLFAGPTPQRLPYNWVLCDGASYSVSQYQALYAVLGFTWGGNGRTTFAVPDLRGRVPVGQGPGTNLTPRTIGQTGGSESVTLTQAQIPAHTHTVYALKTPGTSASPAGTMPAQLTSPYVGYLTPPAQSTVFPFANSMIESTGSNEAHENRMPYLALTYIIAVNGMFPPRP